MKPSEKSLTGTVKADVKLNGNPFKFSSTSMQWKVENRWHHFTFIHDENTSLEIITASEIKVGYYQFGLAENPVDIYYSTFTDGRHRRTKLIRGGCEVTQTVPFNDGTLPARAEFQGNGTGVGVTVEVLDGAKLNIALT
ncbi:hypothetical protein FFI16_003310 [Pseudomonas sp. KBS0710]|uniref:hypothetical protein n=1 Tax=Pseudomonas sp. KBS0710 TaxID=1179667 RepID=UPI00110F1D43|nr:hypothetical protein [Pseudomonas sp. KBS0710]TSD75486.1 hypothetical protein FFI16_003310 [Pseudomonas sp. KBS0710]